MKPFKKNLQAVGTVRQRRENEALQAYATALMNRVRAKERLETAERSLAEAQADWQREAVDGCDAGVMAGHSLHCESLHRIRQERINELAQAELLAEARMSDLIYARQQRKAVDKYHARQRMIYDRAVAREDQKTLDELAHRRVECVREEYLEGLELC